MNSLERRRPAIFLDRDGVILEDVHHLWRISHARFIPTAKQALRLMRKEGYKIIIITNQAGIAKGVYTLRDYYRLNRWMLESLKKAGIIVHGVYFCPHHPRGVIMRYTNRCDCRKPRIGMLEKAARDLRINLKKSWFIGDKTSDILAGKRAGCKTILVRTGYAGTDKVFPVKPDFQKKNLLTSVHLIHAKRLSDHSA